MKAFFHPGGWPVRILLCVGLAVLLVVGGLRPATPYPKLLTETLGEEALPYLQRLGLSTQDAGLRVEALAYACDGGQARLYLTVQDLTGDLLYGEDPTMQVQSIMPSEYSEQKMSFHGGKLIGYDAQERTALLEFESGTFGLYYSEPEPPASGYLDAVAFLSEWTRADIDLGITLAEIQALNPTHRPNPDPYGSGLDFDSYVRELPEIGWARISNIGMVGDRVHILTEPTTPSGAYGNLYFHLEDKDGNWLDSRNSVDYSSRILADLTKMPSLANGLRDYREDGLSVPEGADPETTRLMLNADGYRNMVMGSWNLNFPMRQSAPIKQGAQEAQVTGEDGSIWTVRQVLVTPLCAVVYGIGSTFETMDGDLPGIELVLADGTVQTMFGHGTGIQFRQFSCSSSFDTPRNIEDVVAVRFGDVDFPVA